MIRTVTLYGRLVGPIWQPGIIGEQAVTTDLHREASRLVNATGSGLVDPIRTTPDGAGDFRCAWLVADSFVIIENRREGSPDGTVRSWCRRVDVTNLPSLADYVAAESYAYGED